MDLYLSYGSESFELAQREIPRIQEALQEMYSNGYDRVVISRPIQFQMRRNPVVTRTGRVKPDFIELLLILLFVIAASIGAFLGLGPATRR